jgi:hypothetical protein
MQRRLFSSLLGLAIVIALPRVAYAAEDDLSGFTLQQLDAAITKGGLATQKMYSILTFDSDERRGANIAILSSSHTGWHVTVLHRIQGGLKMEWRSGKLPNDIEVSSSNNFEIEYMDDGEQVVEFSGRAAHDCGDLNGVFGVLLYSPRSKQVFFTHYRFDEGKPLGSFGSLEFSENASAAGNDKYKMKLQKAMNKTLGQ